MASNLLVSRLYCGGFREASFLVTVRKHLPVLIGVHSSPSRRKRRGATPDPFVVQITQTRVRLFNTAIGDMTPTAALLFVSTATQPKKLQREITRTAIARSSCSITAHNVASSRSQHATFDPTDSRPRARHQVQRQRRVRLQLRSPTPADLTQVKIEIDSRSPMITLAPALVGGVRSYIIVFSSNAPSRETSTALSGRWPRTQTPRSGSIAFLLLPMSI